MPLFFSYWAMNCMPSLPVPNISQILSHPRSCFSKPSMGPFSEWLSVPSILAAGEGLFSFTGAGDLRSYTFGGLALPWLTLLLPPWGHRYPVILSIENHCSVIQQKKMAQYLTDILGDKLDLSSVSGEDATMLPSPQMLKGKILVKVSPSLPLLGPASCWASGL